MPIDEVLQHRWHIAHLQVASLRISMAASADTLRAHSSAEFKAITPIGFLYCPARRSVITVSQSVVP
jgi:hypothetical protein